MADKNRIKILLLEDDPNDVTLIERQLTRGGILFETQCVDTRDDFIESIQSFKPDVILCDHGLPQFNSEEALAIVKGRKLVAPLILVTGTVSEEFAIASLHNGASDYILKSNLSRLPTAIQRAIKEKKMRQLKRKAQRSLKRQHSELLKAHAELDKFVYSISHNLRGPLSSVMGLLHLADKENSIEELRHFHTLMNGRLKQLDNTIREFLDYNHNTSLEVKSEIIDWPTLIINAFQKLQPLHQDSRILMNFVQQKDFYSDAYRINVILNNLLTNALIYRNGNREHFVTVEVEVKESECILKIGDNGSGINDDILPFIFDMFYRGHIASQGAGLGLFIVKEIVNKLNGTIEVASSAQGTVMKVFLPHSR